MLTINRECHMPNISNSLSNTLLIVLLITGMKTLFLHIFNVHMSPYQSGIDWGGFWINIVLPQFVAMDLKPVNGCEIQNICCASSRVILRMKLVEAAEKEDAHA